MHPNRLPTVTICIAAYNAQDNIERLLRALMSQSQKVYTLESISVYSDCSTDDTFKIAKSISSPVLHVKQGRKRLGFASVVAKFMSESTSDHTILLNDDILIEDTLLIDKLVSQAESTQAGLLCANPLPLKTTNFIARAINSSFYAYHSMAMHVRNGNCMFTYDGKVMSISRAFREKLVFPKDLRLVGNVDAYIYFSCLQAGFSYSFVKEAIVWYLSPTTLKDFLRWFIRNNANDPIMRKQFGSLVDEEGRKPRIIFLYCIFVEFLKNPLGSLFVFIFSFYIRFRAGRYARNFEQTWEVVSSTKRLAQI